MISADILEKIELRFLSQEIIDESWLRPLEGKIWRDESVNRLKKKALSFLNGSRPMHDVNHYVLRHLATFCLIDYYKEKDGSKFPGLVKTSGSNFNDLILDYVEWSYLDIFRPERRRLFNVFRDSFSWLMGNQGKPVIYFNTNKLEVEKEKGSGPFRLAAWLLHELCHIILHWGYFEKDGNISWKSLVDLKAKVSGAKLEEDAWNGAIQLLEVLKDHGLISEFNNNHSYYNWVVEEIFMKYKAEDIKRANLRL